MATLIAAECRRLNFPEDSSRTDKDDKTIFRHLKSKNLEGDDQQGALVTLMWMLHAHYGEQVILLRDEYDVPLGKASSNG